MYSDFYKLNGSPFRLNPDHRFFYVAEPHQKAIAHLQYALIRSEGFVVITGEVGAGKTTLVNRMLSELEESRYITGNIVTSFVEHADLIHLVASTFGVGRQGADKATLLLNIRDFLEEQRTLGRHPILFVDEVQNLPESSLEELRMLSNFSLPGESLLQIFLVGQPEFRETLADESMEQLRQRVITACHLGTLDAEDTRNYVAHRLRLANWQGDPGFSARSFELIHILSRGVPRRINQICDRLLLYGYLEQIHRIDAHAVAAVARDMTDEGLINAPASVLNPEENDDTDAEISPVEVVEEATEPEFADTPLPEEFLAEMASHESLEDFLSVDPQDADVEPDKGRAADTGLDAVTAPPQAVEPEHPLDRAEEEAQIDEDSTTIAGRNADLPEASGELEPATAETDAKSDADSEAEAEQEVDAPTETAKERETSHDIDSDAENDQENLDDGDAEHDAESEAETEQNLVAAASETPESAAPVVSLPLYLPDEALADGPTEGRSRSSRRWPLAAGAALAASIVGALFVLPDDVIQKHMISSEDLVVSQDLDLRTVSQGEALQIEAGLKKGQGQILDAPVSDSTVLTGDGDAAAKKGPYIIPTSTTLQGSAALAKVPPETQSAKLAQTTLVAALPVGESAGKPETDALPGQGPIKTTAVEERFLIQLATLRTQDEASELRNRFEERFKDLLADFGLGVRHANIAGAEYFRVMTELGGVREKMFDICTQIKSKDQSCILVLDRASQAQAVN